MIARPVQARDPEVAALLEALTAELAQMGYTDEETFGYTNEQLERARVHLVGVRLGPRLIGVGGVELQPGRAGELKRFYVVPDCRGTGAADVLIAHLIAYAGEEGVTRLRLETGRKQHAAIRFYRRHGFVEIPRFGPYVDCATSVCLQREIRSAT